MVVSEFLASGMVCSHPFHCSQRHRVPWPCSGQRMEPLLRKPRKPREEEVPHRERGSLQGSWGGWGGHDSSSPSGRRSEVM